VGPGLVTATRLMNLTDGDEVDKVDQKLDAHELDIFLTRSNGTIDQGQKDQWVGRVGRVVYLIVLPVMEAQDHQTAKVKTAVVKMPKPVVNYRHQPLHSGSTDGRRRRAEHGG
jgi:hypothetical protein